MIDFRVGQEVECVRADWFLGCTRYRLGPCVGDRLKISGKVNAVAGDGRVFLALRFEQFRHNYGFEAVHPIDGSPNFRPVISRPTSIEIFQHILLNPKAPIAPEFVD